MIVIHRYSGSRQWYVVNSDLSFTPLAADSREEAIQETTALLHIDASQVQVYEDTRCDTGLC